MDGAAAARTAGLARAVLERARRRRREEEEEQQQPRERERGAAPVSAAGREGPPPLHREDPERPGAAFASLARLMDRAAAECEVRGGARGRGFGRSAKRSGAGCRVPRREVWAGSLPRRPAEGTELSPAALGSGARQRAPGGNNFVTPQRYVTVTGWPCNARSTIDLCQPGDAMSMKSNTSADITADKQGKKSSSPLKKRRMHLQENPVELELAISVPGKLPKISTLKFLLAPILSQQPQRTW